MQPLFDSFWRALGYCLHPRVVLLSLFPLLLIAAVVIASSYFLWEPAVVWVQTTLEGVDWPQLLLGWLHGMGAEHWQRPLASLLVVLVATPLIVMLSVLAVELLLEPAVLTLVARRRFPQLQRKQGASLALSVLWSLGSFLAAMLALVVSVPLWLVPPLVVVLPPLIWGWLTYRVMAFDALAEHASREEREVLFKRHQWSLLFMGVLCGLMGAAPGVVWASGVVFAAAFFILVPLAIWIYTLVFAFACLWFTHYCLFALQQLRHERGEAADVVVDANEEATKESDAAPPPEAPEASEEPTVTTP